MDGLSGVERELVALGAAMGSNCVSCVEQHVPAARGAGLSERQIGEALRLAETMRRAAARRMLEVARRLASSPDQVHEEPEQSCCG